MHLQNRTIFCLPDLPLFLKGLSKNNKITQNLSPSSFLPTLPHLKVIIFMCSQGDLLRTLQVHGINLHILSLGINGVSGEFAEKTQVIKWLKIFINWDFFFPVQKDICFPKDVIPLISLLNYLYHQFRKGWKDGRNKWKTQFRELQLDAPIATL